MSLVAVVTGANQGLGYALVEHLLTHAGPGAIVYLTARDPQRGEAAAQQLRAVGLAPRVHRLDVCEPDSVAALADHVVREHGGVDVVISNAAARIGKDVPAAAQVRNFVATNNLGTTRVLAAFAPVLHDGGRLVVVASSFGTLRHLPAALHDRFDAAGSLAQLDAVMLAYVESVERGEAEAEGWPAWINIASKVGQVAAVRLLARQLRTEFERRDILVNAACPGLVDTEASRPWFADMSKAQSPAQAAVDVAWLATLPPGRRAPYGELVRFREPLPWR